MSDVFFPKAVITLDEKKFRIFCENIFYGKISFYILNNKFNDANRKNCSIKKKVISDCYIWLS